MSTRRDDDAPLTGGRAPSSTQPTGSRSEPEAGSGSGPGGPVLSTGPGSSSAAGPGSGSRARPPAPAPTGPALRVVLVSRDNMLAGALRSLIEAPGGVRMLDWHSDELDSAIRYADVVVVDMPPNLHQRTFAVIEGRFLGRTVVLLQEGEHPEALPPGPPRAILYRPLQIGELWGAVTGALPAIPATTKVAEAAVVAPEDEPAPPVDPGDPGSQAPATEGQGLPVAESGRMVGLSGQELDPVIGPGQVAPGMDEATLERLRRWRSRGRQPTTGRSGAAAGKRRDPAGSAEAARADRPTVGRAKAAEARREQSRQARTEARQAARADAARVRAARAEARTAAQEQSRQAKDAQARERQAAREQSRQARQAEQAAAAEATREAEKVRQAEQAAARAAAQKAKAARQAEQAAAREAARQAKAAQEAEKVATREAARQARAAEAAVKAAAAEAAREAKKAREAELAAAKEAERQAKAARAAELAAAREAARKARAEDAAARRAERAEARQVKAEQARTRRAEQAEARRVAREQSRQARAVRAAVRRAVRAEAAQARATRREESKRVRTAKAEERRAARAQARQERAARTQARREQSRQERATRAEERRTAREAAGQAKAAAAEVRREETQRARAAQAEARREASEEATRQRAARAEARTAARDEARQAKAARAQAQQAARAEAAQARAAQAEQRRAARAEAGRERAAQAKVRRDEGRRVRAARAEARKEAHDEAARQRAAHAEARQAARGEARAEAARRRAARAAARKRAQEEARAAQAAQAETRQEARAEATQRRKASAEARATAREEARRARLARAEERRAARAEATRGADGPGVIHGQSRIRTTRTPARFGITPHTARLLEAAAPILVVALALAAVGLAAAGWRGGGGPDTVAGEVAVVRAAGGSQGGLVAQDPRVGPIAPLHALVVGAWLRVTEAGGSLEAVIREARGPSRVVLAGVVGLTVLLFLLLMRVGPGSGAAAGPGPAPPQGRRRWWLLGAALAGALVALDPLLVRNGRAATGTILAVALALAALALAWGLPARPALRWVPLVGAVGGLALLVSPLALPVLAVPVVAELLEGRHREAWRGMAALGLALGLWLLLPIWVAGQGLDPGQVGWLLGRPPGRGPLTASLAGEPLSWLLVAAGLAAALLTWRLRSGARPGTGPGAARLPAWAGTTAAGALVVIAIGYPASQALALAIPAAAVSLSLALLAAATATRAPRWVAAATGVALAGLLVAQGLSWGTRYGQPADDGLGRLVATVAAQVPACSAVNAAGPDDRARLLAAGVTVTEFSSGPAAHAAGVRYFALTGATAQGGPQTRSLAAWVRQHGSRLADLPSPSLSGIELWRVDAGPLDPVADIVPIPGGIFSNVTGSACGGYRVVDSQLGAFHTGYRAAGGKAVLGRPLGTVWTSDGPALQAFDTMVLGATLSASGPPDVKPIELPPLLAKLDVEAVADADIPLPSARPPVTDRQARALLDDRLIARAYLGTSPGSASAEDWRRARERFGRPLGRAQTMPDGAVRQPFERAVLELPADGGPVRPAALGRLAARLGLVPRQAMRPEPVPGLPARPAEVRLDPSPLLRPLGVALVLLAVAAAAGAVSARRSRDGRAETARTGR